PRRQPRRPLPATSPPRDRRPRRPRTRTPRHHRPGRDQPTTDRLTAIGASTTGDLTSWSLTFLRSRDSHTPHATPRVRYYGRMEFLVWLGYGCFIRSRHRGSARRADASPGCSRVAI